MPTRYRCSGCGNLTRFDVVATRRTKAFHHFSVGGDLSVEDEEVLEELVEDVTCRWCGAGRDRIETVSDEMPDGAPAEARPTNDGAPTPRAAG
ncbi:MAG: hypothetical protein ACT4PI_15785 [Actinomycetota bacterium]